MLLWLWVIFPVPLVSSSFQSSEPATLSAKALLSWKGSLLDSQHLESWKFPLNPTNDTSDAMTPCEWRGIECDESESVVSIKLAGCGLVGTLTDLNFSSFPALTTLDLSSNMLNGSIPSSISSLRRIQFLSLSDNLLTGQIPSEITSLSSLRSLTLSWNKLNGSIPASIGSKMSNLTCLSLSRNMLSGSVPPELGFLNLQVLDLHHNSLTGELSNIVSTNWTQLTKLVLSINNFVGNIPHNVSLLSSLQHLDLSLNELNGSIPPSLGNLRNLSELILSSNSISGSIPHSFSNLNNLVVLSLHTNQISGSIPPIFWNLVQLQNVKLFGNSLSGQIPQHIGNWSMLTVLDLSSNNFSGPVPTAILDLLPHLDLLNLSHNNLSGIAPDKHLTTLSPSTFVDFSYNNLQFPLDYKDIFPPQALIGNIGFLVTESPTNKKDHHHRNQNIIIVVVILVPLPVMSLIFFMYVKFLRNSRKRDVQIDPWVANEMTSSNLFSIWNFDGRTVFEDIIKATENFDDIYCLGTGAHGSVYKAELQRGQVVAVKRYHHSEDGEMSGDTSFQNEIQALAEIRHCNIVKLYGFCSHPQYMFMVYEYMERGSLSSILCNKASAIELDWERRVKTVKAIADALCYMHHDCKPVIVHRDIKSNNILFDSEFRAYVSDFGTAKMLKQGTSDWTDIAGTCGYIAPGTNFYE